MTRDPDRRRQPAMAMPGARSIIVVGMNYNSEESSAELQFGGCPPLSPPQGQIARYALGDDYHEVMRERLQALLTWIQERAGHEARGRAYVDTGPLLERDLARRAGLGW